MFANNSSSSIFLPTVQSERIVVLDSLRGIAVLGILLMNIPFFGLPDPAGYNPVAMDEIGTINEKIYIFISTYIDGTQRALFSLLFGAGVLLFTDRLQKRSAGIEPADYFIKRQLWLIVFGLFNAYILLWPGDILFAYGICGIVVFPFRKLSVKWLLVAAGISLVLMTIRENVNLYRKKQVIIQGERAAMVDSVKRTPEQKADLQAMQQFKEKTSTQAIKEEMRTVLKKMQGSFGDAYDYLSEIKVKVEIIFTYYGLWDILLFMFLGMAFFKSGILTGQASLKLYLIMGVAGLLLGSWLSWMRLHPAITLQYNLFDIVKQAQCDYYEIARAFRSLGVFGCIMVLYKSGWFRWLFSLMQPVGQMAFTNYLTQSFLCNLFFLGCGMGMIGKMDRKEIYLFAFGIWLLQIIWSHLWMKFFRFGTRVVLAESYLLAQAAY